jgi:multisubunit Na+/H+ antiporter MnhG subunit
MTAATLFLLSVVFVAIVHCVCLSASCLIRQPDGFTRLHAFSAIGDVENVFTLLSSGVCARVETVSG